MSHKAKVLALLSDGKPHSHMEGYRLGVMLHSRVADLRRDGHVIECWRVGDDYLYRLVSLDASAGDGAVPQTPPFFADASSDTEPVQPQLFAVPRGAYDEVAA